MANLSLSLLISQVYGSDTASATQNPFRRPDDSDERVKATTKAQGEEVATAADVSAACYPSTACRVSACASVPMPVSFVQSILSFLLEKYRVICVSSL